jgi:hypothetical protein
MKFKTGQIIGNYCCNFDNEEQLISSHVIIEVLPDLLRLYCIYCHPFGFVHELLSGDITEGIKHIESQDESQNNFYWRIQNEV